MVRTKDEKNNHQKCNTIKYNLCSLNDESTKIRYQQRYHKSWARMYRNLQKLSMNTCDCIHSAAREALGEQGKGKRVVENMYG
jgi:hypothetical protein